MVWCFASVSLCSLACRHPGCFPPHPFGISFWAWLVLASMPLVLGWRPHSTLGPTFAGSPTSTPTASGTPTSSPTSTPSASGPLPCWARRALVGHGGGWAPWVPQAGWRVVPVLAGGRTLGYVCVWVCGGWGVGGRVWWVGGVRVQVGRAAPGCGGTWWGCGPAGGMGPGVVGWVGHSGSSAAWAFWEAAGAGWGVAPVMRSPPLPRWGRSRPVAQACPV